MGPLRNRDEAAAPIGALAERAIRWGLATPAILFAECVKPLEFVMSQFLRVMAPVAGLFAPAERIEALAAALEERGGIESFVREVERLVGGAEPRAPAPDAAPPPPRSDGPVP
jgi:hypothetical protein